ncbi:MAG: hypothetical protein LRY48_00175, partial [Bacteroides graminisolvens]|nr:hypothetical protein [Bacteroides graminisolvens]
MEEGTIPVNDSSVDAIEHFLKFLKQNIESRKGKSIEEKEEEYYRSIEEKEEYDKDNEEVENSIDKEKQQNEDVDTKVTTKSKLDKVKDYIKNFKDVVSPLFTNMDESPINEKLEKISELQRNIDTL